MLDRHINKVIAPPLEGIAKELAKMKVTANQLTLMGFVCAVAAFIQIAFGNYGFGLAFILLNRFFDGVDGKVAQIHSPTDSGGFLDIVFDFIFYAAIPLAFGISLPESQLASLILTFSFVTTGTTFLAFSTIAEKLKLQNIDYPNKSFYYLGGIAEGGETFLFFVLFCVFPFWFSGLAYVFATLCFITAIFRIVYGYKTLSKAEKSMNNPQKKIYNNIL